MVTVAGVVFVVAVCVLVPVYERDIDRVFGLFFDWAYRTEHKALNWIVNKLDKEIEK